ncbi:MAG: tolQ: protein TolQ [Firmicutes bacterium]|nr:tolQ: protein TolQ [Bacillota bacterium]
MLPLLICSIVAVGVIIERYLYFRRIGAADIAEQVLEMVSCGKSDEARFAAVKSSLPLPRVLAAGIVCPADSSRGMEAQAVLELSAMRRGMPVLDTIITLSPLLGLLGTIVGMISSFQIMAAQGMGQPHAVTGGVAEALIATATGITVAVIALIPYNYFLSRIERETELIEHYATRLEIALENLAKG